MSEWEHGEIFFYKKIKQKQIAANRNRIWKITEHTYSHTSNTTCCNKSGNF